MVSRRTWRDIVQWVVLALQLTLGDTAAVRGRAFDGGRVRRAQAGDLGISVGYDSSRFTVQAEAARSMAAMLSVVDTALTPEMLQEMLRHMLMVHEDIYGSCISFEPDSYPCAKNETPGCTASGLRSGVPSATGVDVEGESRWVGQSEPWMLPAIDLWPGESAVLYAPYAYRGPDWQDGMPFHFLDLADGYNFFNPATEWYHGPRTRFLRGQLNFSEGYWTAPYFDAGAGNIEMVTFSVPFVRKGAVRPVVHPQASDPSAAPYGFPVAAPMLDSIGRERYFWGIATIDLVLDHLVFDCGDTAVFVPELKACRNCSAGYLRVRPQLGSPFCAPCEEGAFSLEGDLQCRTCPLGKFQISRGQSFCESCAVGQTTGKLQLVRGQTVLLEFEGARTRDDCSCLPGTSSFTANATCITCSDGLYCPGGNHLEVLLGYWCPVDQPLLVFRCQVGKACPGGLAGSCAAHRDSSALACAKCAPGYVSEQDGGCRPCVGADYAPSVALAVCLLVMLCCMYLFVAKERRAAQGSSSVLTAIIASQTITMLQQLTIVDSLGLNIPKPFSNFLNALSFLNLDVNLFNLGCFGKVSAQVQYGLQVFGIFGLFVCILILHFFVTLLWKRTIRESMPLLTGTTGTMFLTALVPIVSALVAPLRCVQHPGGLRTVSTFPSVLCWSDDFNSPHRGMVAISIAACTVPFFVVTCIVYAVAVLPRKLREGDDAFFKATSFLFCRLRMETHWYILIFTVRNMVLTLIPIMADASAQIVSMCLLMVASLGSVCHFLPWRVFQGNLVDVSCCFGMIFILVCLAFFVTVVAVEVLATLSLAIILAVLLMCTMCLVRAWCLRLLRRGRRWKLFLCHHKEHAGNFARLLKMYLVEQGGCHGRVFLDSDNLFDLSALFDIVRSDLEQLVVVCTSCVLLRSWCVGEITVAHLSRVKIKPLHFPCFKSVDSTFINLFKEQYNDWSFFAEHGLSLDMVRGAFQHLNGLQAVDVSLPIQSSGLDELVCQVLDGRSKDAEWVSRLVTSSALVGSSGFVFTKAAAGRPTSIPQEQSISILVLSLDHSEAVSAALVIRRMLTTMASRREVVVVDAVALGGRSCVVLLCSEGILTNLKVLEMVVSSINLGASVLPVIIQRTFAFPTQTWLQQELAAAGLQQSYDLPDLSRMLTSIFNAIAVNVNLHTNEELIEASARQVFRRIVSDTKPALPRAAVYRGSMPPAAASSTGCAEDAAGATLSHPSDEGVPQTEV